MDAWLSNAACWFSSMIFGVSVGGRVRREEKEREESPAARILPRSATWKSALYE